MSSDSLSLTLLVLACGAVSYAWRGLGVWIAGRIDVDSAIFRWVTCVAYAILAGLIARVLVFPVGTLATTHLWQRLAGVAVALAVFHATRKSMLAGVLAGAAALPVIVRFA